MLADRVLVLVDGRVWSDSTGDRPRTSDPPRAAFSRLREFLLARAGGRGLRGGTPQRGERGVS